MVAENDHLQIFQNYENLKKQIKTVWKRFCLKFNFKYKYFLVKIWFELNFVFKINLKLIWNVFYFNISPRGRGLPLADGYHLLIWWIIISYKKSIKESNS